MTPPTSRISARIASTVWLAIACSSVVGAQLGTRLAQKLKPDHLRLILAFLVLVVAIRLALGLGWRPDEIYSIQPL